MVMNAGRVARTVATVFAIFGLHIVGAIGQVFTVTITADENCNGRLVNSTGFDALLPCSFQTDSGPGGLAHALFYSALNPPGLTQGDLLLQDSASAPDVIFDLIRFDPNLQGGGFFFYSELTDGDALADTGLPSALFANVVTLTEIGAGGNNGVTYTPTSGQPGFVTGAAVTVSYVIRTDVSTVPEPATLALLGMGLLGLAASGRRKLN